MMANISLILLGLALTVLCLGLLCLLYLLWDYYKEREWRRNNPDEHEIMNRKIKDDFTR